MPKKSSRLKIKLNVMICIDGKWHSGDEIVTLLDGAKYELIKQVYNEQLKSAECTMDAVQWTMDLLNISKSTVYNALNHRSILAEK